MRIYKFYKFTNYNINAVRESKIWMSSPVRFNDPFDARLRVSSNDEIEIRKLLALFIEHKNLGEAPAVLRQIVDYYTYDMMEEPFSHYFYEAIEDKQENFNDLIRFIKDYSTSEIPSLAKFCSLLSNLGICSFTTEVHSPIMWAHYGDNHTGFCVEYELDELPSSFDGSLVTYDQRLPSIVDISYEEELNKKDIVRQLCTKGEEWKYENEYRLISQTHREKLVRFPGVIKNIYYGINASDENIKLLKAVVEANNDIYHHTAMFASELRKFNFTGSKLNSEDPLDISINFADKSLLR